MTVSISRMNIEYYLSTIAVGDTTASRKHLTNYYTSSGDPAGTWFGQGLTGISRSNEQTVTKHDARAVFEDIAHPDTNTALGKRPMQKTDAPQGAKIPSQKPVRKQTREAVAGFDLTFSAPKSVSTLWAIADSATQATIHQAHQDAVRNTLTWLENNVIQSRAGDGGIAKAQVQGIIATLFDHFDSRAGDPQLHTHAVLSNRVQRAADGAWVTLDSYALHKWVVTASEMYNATLFDELAKTAGTHTELRQPLHQAMHEEMEKDYGNRRIELTGIPDELIIEFSQRASAIDEITNRLIEQYKAEHGENITAEKTLELRRQATLESRDAKPADKAPLSTRLYQWRERTRALGLKPADILTQATGHPSITYTAETFTDEAVTEIAQNIIKQTSIKHPTFTRANLTASAHRLSVNIRFNTLEERNEFTERLVETALTQAVALTPDRYELDHLTQTELTLRGTSVFDRKEDKIYTTQHVLDIEKDLMDATRDSQATHLTDAQTARKILTEHVSDKGHSLAPDQLEAAFKVTTEASTISAIIGPAGTGKTSTLAGVRAAWENTYGQDSIIGLAPSAAAASVLAKDLGISTDNTAKWLYESVGEGVGIRAQKYARTQEKITRLEQQLTTHPTSRVVKARLDAERTNLATLIAEQAKYTFKPGQLLIVDESSMSSTADLHQLHAQIQAAGGKMLLVGDPKQLDAVEAGGFLGWMENEELSANLTSVWRFTADWEKQASLQLRDGDIEVLDTYRAHGRIIETSDILDSAYSQWLADTTAGQSSVLIAGTNAEVQELNIRAQTERINRGDVDTTNSFAIRSGNTAHTGDTILARQNNRQLLDSQGEFIKNGTRLTVNTIGNDVIEATREDTGATITIPRTYAEQSIELGYAATIHRAQGLTVETCHVAVDSSFGREQLYVAMTRGKASNTIYVDGNGEEKPESPDNWNMMHADVAENSQEVLARVLARSNRDKTAHETMDAEHGWAYDLGRAVSELDYIHDISATRRTHQWIKDRFNLDASQVADTPELKDLIRAVKNSHLDYSHTPETVTNVKEATEFFRDNPAPPTTALLETPAYTTADEQEATTAITENIHARLEQLKTLHADDAWFKLATIRHPEAIDAILTWRALSHQTEAETALGKAPSAQERRLTVLYHKVENIIEHAENLAAKDLAYEDHTRYSTGNWETFMHDDRFTTQQPHAPVQQPSPEHRPDMN